MIRVGQDILDPSKTIIPCKFKHLTYTIENLRLIGLRILIEEVISKDHVYIVAEKQFKRIESQKCQ